MLAAKYTEKEIEAYLSLGFYPQLNESRLTIGQDDQNTLNQGQPNMNFTFSAIDTNNAKIEQLKQQIEALQQDNTRILSIQNEAQSAIAQLNDVFSKMVGAGIDSTSMTDFRTLVGSTIGIADNSTKVEQQQQLIGEQDEKIASLSEALAATQQERDDYQSMWNACVGDVPLEREEEFLDAIAIALPEDIATTASQSINTTESVHPFVKSAQDVAETANSHPETVAVTEVQVDLIEENPLPSHSVFKTECTKVEMTEENPFLTDEEKVDISDRIKQAEELVKASRQVADKKTSKKKAQKPNVEAVEPSVTTPEAGTTVRAESETTTASLTFQEENAVQAADGIEDEEDEIYPINARPGNVFRTNDHPKVLMLARNSRLWLGKVLDTEDVKKFSPSEIVSFAYTSAHRTKLLELDKTDIDNYFATGETVQSKFSSHRYGVLTSNPVETLVTAKGKETLFWSLD